ncbi:LysR family transcriptional regulator [Achromobacter seleniivolatilans]|uniref:LysR family transcriptional regulator n=1 Tax=Achromobacter seleniivolatilans TaxID=3047478 RepID=A0ABY9LU67_9BURK|nr:LysR family transcriptional regulator [Achromobacter sp. R39]WMD18324.1 LysR family transcriptional regulator [Achromobacter sp. R39]
MAPVLDEILLRTFIEATRRGSFGQAAAAMKRTQAAVTLQIRRLEEILDQPLFNRTTRGVTLTTGGLEFLPYAERILALGIEAHEFMARHKMPIDKRPRRIRMIEDLSSIAALDHGLARIRRLFDPIKIDLNFDSGPQAEEAFRAGKVDMLIGDRLRAPLGDIEPISVASVPLVWAASPDFDARQRPLPLAVYGAPCIWREQVVATLDGAAIASRIAVESHGTPALLSAVRSGSAIAALLPSSVGAGLVALDPAAAGFPPPPKVEIVLYQSQHALRDPVIKELSSALWQGVEGLAA